MSWYYRNPGTGEIRGPVPASQVPEGAEARFGLGNAWLSPEAFANRERYPALITVRILLYVGALVLGCVLIAPCAALVDAPRVTGWMKVQAAINVVLAPTALVGLAELIRVLVDIERNTRRR